MAEVSDSYRETRTWAIVIVIVVFLITSTFVLWHAVDGRKVSCKDGEVQVVATDGQHVGCVPLSDLVVGVNGG